MKPAEFPRRPSLSLWTMGTTSVLFFLFVAWLGTYQVEEVTKVAGSLEPTVGNAPIQFPAGGVIVDLAVAEGQRIKRGDALLRIDSLSANDTVDSLREQILILESQRIHLEALTLGRRLTRAQLAGVRGDLAENQLNLYAGETASYQASLEVFRTQKASLDLQVRERKAELVASTGTSPWSKRVSTSRTRWPPRG